MAGDPCRLRTAACGLRLPLATAPAQARLQVSSQGLLAFDGFEQRLEIALPESPAPFPLDDLEEEGGAIFHRAREQLQEIPFVVAIDQYAQPTDSVVRFIDVADAIRQHLVV